MLTAGGARPTGARSYRFDVFSQVLYCGNDLLQPTRRELELLTYLAFCDRTVTKDQLAEAFAPQSTSEAADRLLRVTVARIRKKYGDALILSGRGGYALGPNVTNSLREASTLVARCSAQTALSRADANMLNDLGRRIEAYFAGGGPALEWGADLDRLFEDLLQAIRSAQANVPVADVTPRAERSRGRALAAGAIILALVTIVVNGTAVLSSWARVQRRDQLALARRLGSEDVSKALEFCRSMRHRCITAESLWLSTNVPKWSNITTPRVPSYYSVPALKIDGCNIAFSKVYTAVNSTAIVDRSDESGTLAQGESIFFDYRDYGGGWQRFSPWRAFPTVILESYRPFLRRHLHRPPDTYKYIFFLFDSKQNALKVLRHLQLVSRLCGSGPWTVTDWRESAHH